MIFCLVNKNKCKCWGNGVRVGWELSEWVSGDTAVLLSSITDQSSVPKFLRKYSLAKNFSLVFDSGWPVVSANKHGQRKYKVCIYIYLYKAVKIPWENLPYRFHGTHRIRKSYTRNIFIQSFSVIFVFLCKLSDILIRKTKQKKTGFSWITWVFKIGLVKYGYAVTRCTDQWSSSASPTWGWKRYPGIHLAFYSEPEPRFRHLVTEQKGPFGIDTSQLIHFIYSTRGIHIGIRTTSIVLKTAEEESRWDRSRITHRKKQKNERNKIK